MHCLMNRKRRMTIQNLLIKNTLEAVAELYQAEIPEHQLSLQETRKEFEGQITLVVFPIVRFSKKSPEQTGIEIGEYLKANIDFITDFNVIKGFLNLSLTDEYWIGRFQSAISQRDYGIYPKNGKKLMLEYSSPNTNKPLHLGHIRNNLLGYSVAEILKVYGYEVIKANLVNDRGIHICKSMVAWQKFGNAETPESTGIKGDHLVGKYYVKFDQEYKKEMAHLMADGQTEDDAKKNAPLILEAQSMLLAWETGNREVVDLWKTMNEWVYAGFEITYKQIGVDFDQYYYESDTYLLGRESVEEGLEKGVFFRKPDNSVWIDLNDVGLDEKLVLRGDGTSVYMTQDIGTAQLKYDDYKMDESIYVVGNEQDYHFKVLFEILKKLGKPWANGLYHLSYGMVDLPSGKMKSREGTVVDADDLMKEMVDTAKLRTEELGKVDVFSEEEKAALYNNIGMGALKYFLLKVEPQKRLLFDPNESIDFQGHTGPFIQYTHARIKSLLTKGKYQENSNIQHPASLNSSELDLIQLLDSFPQVIENSAKAFSPAQLANYIYELSKLYNKFYHEESILKSDDQVEREFRLKLSSTTASIIERGMRLLGIIVPERM